MRKQGKRKGLLIINLRLGIKKIRINLVRFTEFIRFFYGYLERKKCSYELNDQTA